MADEVTQKEVFYFFPVKDLFGKFFLIRKEGLRKEEFTDCKALWGQFVILGYLHKIKLDL